MQKFFRWCKKLSICSWKNSENSDKSTFKKSITKYSILGKNFLGLKLCYQRSLL